MLLLPPKVVPPLPTGFGGIINQKLMVYKKSPGELSRAFFIPDSVNSCSQASEQNENCSVPPC